MHQFAICCSENVNEMYKIEDVSYIPNSTPSQQLGASRNSSIINTYSKKSPKQTKFIGNC